jgi:prephenate dehydrogenase
MKTPDSKTIERIAIIGTGLMGASFALAIRQAGYAGEIVGCDAPEVLAEARAAGAIDAGSPDPVEAVRGAQLVLLATPVVASLELLRTLAPHTQGALITDVGSTKQMLVDEADRLFGEDSLRRFLPGHPMAGREFSGVAAADKDLFRDATWIVTPRGGRHALLAPEFSRGLHAQFLRLLESIGARLVILDPEKHDRMLAYLSHLPQMLSTALAAAVMDELGDDANVHVLTGGGLKGMVRLAASDPAMWTSIAETNTANISDALQAVEREIALLRESLGKENFRREFERARSFNPSAPPPESDDTDPPKF